MTSQKNDLPVFIPDRKIKMKSLGSFSMNNKVNETFKLALESFITEPYSRFFKHHS